jgi:hypothetical protein
MSKEKIAIEILKILLDHVPESEISVASVTLAYTRIMHKLEKMI